MSHIIYDKLLEYTSKEVYPMHMPGHKRYLQNQIQSPYAIDITEIHNFDNMHEPKGIILESLNEVSRIYGCKQSFYLVNGSTAGILAAVSSVCKRGDSILIQRNCHKAVYHAVQLLELKPYYIYSEYCTEWDMAGGIDCNKIKDILDKNDDIKAVLLTSPSYEGIVINIEQVGLLTKEKNIPLIVDEAHGAHFIYHDSFPDSAVGKGADIVIQSIHKTLPSLTQTALLHVCSDMVNMDRIKDYLSIYQTSSPSYLFMASMEYCIDYCKGHREHFNRYADLLIEYRSKLKELDNIYLVDFNDFKVYHAYSYDNSKIVLSVKNTDMTGEKLCKILREQYSIEMEMYEKNYVIAMTSVMDTREGFERFYNALADIDKSITKCNYKAKNFLYKKENEQIYSPGEAMNTESKEIDFMLSEQQVSGSYIYQYPPGIPLIIPGEKIEKELIDYILLCMEKNVNIIGINNGKIKVIHEINKKMW